MIFQLSEREKIRTVPIVRVRYARPEAIKPLVKSNSNGFRESKFTEPCSPVSSPPLRTSVSYNEPEAREAEKQEIKPFQDCEEYQPQGGCQTVLHQRYEGNRGDILRCNTCGRTFSARRGGISFRSRLDPEMLNQLIDCHQRGDSIRKTSKILTLNRGTVRRYFRLLEEGTTIEPE